MSIDETKKQRLAELVKELAVVHGKVTLSSGKEADYYVDLRRATLHREASKLIGQLLRELTADWDYAHVGGLTLGADPVATSIMHAGDDIDAFVVRKEAKKHGMQRRIENIEGKRVLVVEDTTTTGNSPLTAVAAAREAGATVVGVATVVAPRYGCKGCHRSRGCGVPLLAGTRGSGAGRCLTRNKERARIQCRVPPLLGAPTEWFDHPVGMGPWEEEFPGTPRPTQDYFDPELLDNGDRRNVVDEYRYWRMEAIIADIDTRRHSLHIAIENFENDSNIGTVVRTANAFAVDTVHIVGRKRWNRRGAMVTDRYQHLEHHPTVADVLEYARKHDLTVVAVDNTPGSVPLETADLPKRCLLLFGQEVGRHPRSASRCHPDCVHCSVWFYAIHQRWCRSRYCDACMDSSARGSVPGVVIRTSERGAW